MFFLINRLFTHLKIIERKGTSSRISEELHRVVPHWNWYKLYKSSHLKSLEMDLSHPNKLRNTYSRISTKIQLKTAKVYSIWIKTFLSFLSLPSDCNREIGAPCFHLTHGMESELGARLLWEYCSVTLVLSHSMDCSLLGSSVHGILQARILEWIAITFSRRSSQPRDHTCISYISCIGRRVLYC